MNPSPKVITGALHTDNREACDWGFQGFIAYGCHGYIVIVDPNTLQVIQTLGQHKGNVSQIRWARENYHHAFATGSTYSLLLAAADTSGTIIVWDVSNEQSRTEMEASKDTKPVSCMDWYSGYDESHDLLAVLRFPDVLELWDGYSGVRLWRKVLGEPVQSMVFNPFEISSLVLLCESKVLVLSDFKPTSAPGDDYKVIQFVETAQTRQGSLTRRASSTSLRHSRSWSRVISLASTIPSGLLGTPDISKKRQSVSSEEDTEYQTHCLQIAFNPAHRHQLFLVFEREILVLDIDLDISLATIHLDKNSPSFVKIFPCRWTDVIFCLHDNGSLSMRTKRKSSIETPSSNTLVGVEEEPSVREEYVAMEMNYDLCCQSDALRLLRNSKVFTSVHNPVTEKTVAILLSDSRLILWDVLSREIKPCKESPQRLPYTLSELISQEPADRGDTKGKSSLKMVATGLLEGIMSPVTAIGMLGASVSSGVTGNLLAVGSEAGVIQLVNVYSGQIEKAFKLFMSPVKGIDCIDNTTIVAFTHTDPGNYGNRAVKNETVILHTDSGELTDFREKNERRGALISVKVSPSRLLACVMYKEWPVELWNIPNKRLMHNIEVNYDNLSSMTWYPYYQKILPKGDSQPVMTEQLFIGSLHEHGNLLRVNIVEDKMKDIVRLSLSETHSTKTVALTEIVCMAWKDKLFIFADKTSQLFLSNADKKSSTKKIYERLGYKFKSVKFAGGKQNRKFLVVFDDRVDTWEINTLGLEEMLTSSPKFSSPVLDGCWVGADTISVSTADGCIHTMSAVSKRLSEKKLEDGYVYIPDTSMKRVKTPITNWEVPDPVFSPALLEPKTAFLMKYVLQCGLVPSLEEIQSHCQSEVVARQLELLDRDVLSYLINSDVSVEDRCLMVARLFGDECDTDFWRIAQYQIQTGTLDKSLKLAPHFLKTKQFSITDWYNHVTSPLSPREENLLDLGTTEGQGQENSDLDISWVKDLDRVQPLETCFDLMLDEHSYKSYQLSRLCLHNKRRGNYHEKHHCSSRYIMLGVDDMAVQTLMETESDNEGFQNDCLKACLVSSLKSPSTSVSTVKLAATQLIAAGKLSDGVELLCLINKHADACKYYMSFGMWQEAAWLAKISLPKEDSLSVMYRWVILLWSSNEKNKAVLMTLSLGQYTTVLLMLQELKQYDKAALFLQTCLQNKLLEKNAQTAPFIEQIYEEFSKLLSVSGYQRAVDYYCHLAGQRGDNFIQDLGINIL